MKLTVVYDYSESQACRFDYADAKKLHTGEKVSELTVAFIRTWENIINPENPKKPNSEYFFVPASKLKQRWHELAEMSIEPDETQKAIDLINRYRSKEDAITLE